MWILWVIEMDASIQFITLSSLEAFYFFFLTNFENLIFITHTIKLKCNRFLKRQYIHLVISFDLYFQCSDGWTWKSRLSSFSRYSCQQKFIECNVIYRNVVGIVKVMGGKMRSVHKLNFIEKPSFNMLEISPKKVQYQIQIQWTVEKLNCSCTPRY